RYLSVIYYNILILLITVGALRQLIVKNRARIKVIDFKEIPMKRKREIIKQISTLINFIIKLSRILPKKFYLFLLKLIKHHDNYVAMFIRFICLKNCAKSCGDNVAVFSDVYLY